MNARISDEQRQTIAELRERQGWSFKRIAAHVKVSPGAVQYWANRLGAWPEGRKPPTKQCRRPFYRKGVLVRPFSDDEDQQILAMRQDGSSFSEIARRLGRRHHSVMMRLDQLNLWAEASEEQESDG